VRRHRSVFGHALRRLTIAVEHWMNANFDPNADPRRIAAEERRLVAAFMKFLEFFHGESR
jgi:hypothetical protein